MKRAIMWAAPISAALALSGCGGLQRLSEIGRPPALTATADPTADPSWRPVSMPTPHMEASAEGGNSLWRSGSRAFFKDQRASKVGDIITVLVNIADTAALQNNSSGERKSAETMGMPNLFGLEGLLPGMIAKALNVSNLVSTASDGQNTSTGQIARNETVTLRVAGVITQVLPNGNMVVSARQQMEVNSELRDFQVTGVIRPQDIASDNTIPHDRMAEARIIYGGRGQLTNYQTPRIGQQVLDAVLPF